MEHNVPLDDIHLTAADLLSVDVEAVLSTARKREVQDYIIPLSRAAKVAHEAGELIAANTLRVLATVALFNHNHEDARDPFKPPLDDGGIRLVNINDIANSTILALLEMCSEIEDAEFRARVADVAWSRTRNHLVARIAVDAYMSSATQLMDLEKWTTGFHRWQRAMQISNSLGKRSREHQSCIGFALSLLPSLDRAEPSFLTSKVIGLLLDYDHEAVNPIELAVHLESVATKAESVGNILVAIACRTEVIRCLRKSEDSAAKRHAEIMYGEALILKGEQMAAENNPCLASDRWIKDGLRALRRAGADPERLKQLNKRLSQIQQEHYDNMITIVEKVDMDPELVEYLDQVRSMPLRESIEFLGIVARPLPKSDLEQLVAHQARDTKLPFTINKVRQSGRTDTLLPPLNPQNNAPEVLDAHMMHCCNEAAFTVKAATMEYVRRILFQRHQLTDGCLDWLIVGNTLIDPSRRRAFEKGIRAGIEGDFMTAASLLVPQLENSLRNRLEQDGLETTKRKDDNTEKEVNLSQILDSDSFRLVFGEDLSFWLRALLTEPAGRNLRHELCHGLIADDAFSGAGPAILTPTVIHVLLHGLPS